jgi:hypothetical protein
MLHFSLDYLLLNSSSSWIGRTVMSYVADDYYCFEPIFFDRKKYYLLSALLSDAPKYFMID